MALGQNLAEALDPVRLAGRLGLTPDPWQAEVLRSTNPRTLLVCHRQAGKSTLMALAAVHAAVFDPGSLVLMIAPSMRQSQELFRRALAAYRALGRPVPAEAENALSLTLESGSRIVSLPGDERTVRGFSSVKLLVVDEAARVADDLMSAVRPMLAVSNGRVIAASTPFGRRGWFYNASMDPSWRVVTVPAEQCPRITPEFLSIERRSLGEWWYRQEYECSFVDAIGSVFSADDITAIFVGTDGPSPRVIAPPRPALPAPPPEPLYFKPGARLPLHAASRMGR